MNQKNIGYIIIIIAIAMSLFVIIQQKQESKSIESYVEKSGSCFLDDGTCLHEQSSRTAMYGWIFVASLLILGFYLVFFDKTQKLILERQKKITRELREAKKNEVQKDEFKAFIAGFNEEEQTVLKAIKEQDGILQSTLRYRTGITKSTLSLILKSLEERNFISRKPKGKTKEVFLRKNY